MNTPLNIALLQLPPLSPTDTRLHQYLSACKKQKVSLVAFGEYVFNPFFREFDKNHSKEMISAISHNALNTLQKLAKKYKLDIIAPLLLGENGDGGNGNLYKSIVHISNDEKNSIHIYQQQRLIAYPHWNEKKFFDNKIPKSPKTPIVFERCGLNLGVISGFEAHFDELWLRLKNAKVDIVIMPCSNTFGSKTRWRNLCSMRAFTNSMALLRVNRVGSGVYDETQWRFYGDSLFINANGEIEENLGDKEGMLLVSIEKEQILNAQKEWGFRI